jgi:hypothetical protein
MGVTWGGRVVRTVDCREYPGVFTLAMLWPMVCSATLAAFRALTPIPKEPDNELLLLVLK